RRHLRRPRAHTRAARSSHLKGRAWGSCASTCASGANARIRLISARIHSLASRDMDTRVRSTSETSQVVERTGFDVVRLEIRAGERLLVGPLDFSLERGEGLVVVGQMATGK